MLNFYLEVLNSDLSIAAFALAAICVAYFRHECIARDYPWRSQMTRGMRVSIAVFTLSVGTVITRLTIYIWRHVFKGGDFSDLQTMLLWLGGFITLVGFICAIREYSKPLYGNCPWITTLVAIILMTIYNTLVHYHVW